MMKILQANELYLDQISNFFKQAWKEAGSGALGWTGASEDTISDISSLEFLGGLLDRSDLWLFIAIVNEAVVGFSSVEEADTGLLELSGIIVMESWTGRGVGGKLLDYVIDFANTYGYKNIIVKTEKENQRALHFYKKNGFIESKTFTENIEGKSVLLVELSREVITKCGGLD